MKDAATPHGDTASAPGAGNPTSFDFRESAELFTRCDATPRNAAGRSPADRDRARSRATYRNALAYRRFASVAEAIRFAIEELPSEALAATVLVVNGDRHEPTAIRAFYADAAYPLSRRDGNAY